MDLTWPIYMPPNFNISPPNQFAVQQVIKLFLCPSDRGQPVSAGYGLPQFGLIDLGPYSIVVLSQDPPTR